MLNIDEIKKDLAPGEYGEYLTDYIGSDSYICDAYHKIADNNTSIYYHDILKFISENPEALADVVHEGLYEINRNYDLYQHGQMAEYYTILQNLYEHTEDAIKLAILNYIKYTLKLDEISEEADNEIDGLLDDSERLSTILESVDAILNQEAVEC